MDYIIGLDIGTSGTKAVAFRTGGGVVASHRITYPLLNPQPGFFEQDPKVLFSAVMQSIAGVVQTVKNNASETKLLGISFSSAMHGLIAMDSQHEPLTNCITWADTRSESLALQLRNTPEGFRIYSQTGTPIHPMSPLSKLCWMREHLTAVFHKAHKYISIKEYVFLRLFGRYVVDESIASATGLFDINTLNWYPPALELAGIFPNQLSELVPITYTLSGLPDWAANELGVGADTPFVVGGSDGCLASLGAHSVKLGDATVSIGTSGAIRLLADQPITDRHSRTFSYVLTDKLFVLGGAVNSGGMVLQWYRDNFGDLDSSEDAGYEQLAEEAATITAGAGGLVFLPYLAGERAPHWNAKAKGLFFGVQMHHRKAHFTRAIFEGIVYGIYSVAKVLEEIAGPINHVHANGGFARSPFWVQLLSDVFNKQVLVREESVEDAAKGAYVVAMKALGQVMGFEEIEDESIRIVYKPDLEKHRLYMDSFEVFDRLYERVKDEF